MGKVVVELKQDVCPTACDNFRQLCEFKCYTGSMMQVWPEQRIEVRALRLLLPRLPPRHTRSLSASPFRGDCTGRRLHSA
jgi:hypothetical protein